MHGSVVKKAGSLLDDDDDDGVAFVEKEDVRAEKAEVRVFILLSRSFEGC
jgi:hypothetical protein